jgi:two-component system chemotaxis response regulator CheB
MSFAVPAVSVQADAHQPIRVMVVDDSVVVRDLLSRWLNAEPGIKVVAALRTGREAVDQFERHRPDVVLLDIEMPVLDGLSALPMLLAMDRDLVVVMVSTVTRHHAEAGLKALSLGAADYIPKPESGSGGVAAAEFRRELLDKIRNLGSHRRRRFRWRRGLAQRQPDGTRPETAAGAAASIRLRPFAAVAPRVVVIGASTGGPQALNALVAQLSGVIGQAALLITQHMPPSFTTILAEHLARASHCPAREAIDREPIVPGRIYVAPGGRHMRVGRANHGPVVALDDGPPINFCRPAVDPLFSSAARTWGPAVVAVILTGMGVDGTGGAADIVAAGGSVIAQDEATSVVWGMPGAAAQAGLCSAVLPLDQIAGKVAGLFAGERR